MNADRPSSSTAAPLGPGGDGSSVRGGVSVPNGVDRESIEARLDALERASDQRRAELTELAASIPAAVSRRAVLRAVAGDLRSAPDKRGIVARAGRRLGRSAGAVRRRIAAFGAR